MVANFNKPPETKKKKAVALKYDTQNDVAPRVAAKGSGAIAEKILAVAAEHHIPIESDADLTEILAKVDLDAYVPLEVYAVVAEIFAYIYKANKKYHSGRQNAP